MFTFYLYLLINNLYPRLASKLYVATQARLSAFRPSMENLLLVKRVL